MILMVILGGQVSIVQRSSPHFFPKKFVKLFFSAKNDVDLAIEKIYERKFIPNDTKNEGQDEKIEEAMSDYGSDIVESRILDSNNQ